MILYAAARLPDTRYAIDILIFAASPPLPPPRQRAFADASHAMLISAFRPLLIIFAAFRCFSPICHADDACCLFLFFRCLFSLLTIFLLIYCLFSEYFDDAAPRRRCLSRRLRRTCHFRAADAAADMPFRFRLMLMLAASATRAMPRH